MDGSAFDHLTRTLTTPRSRRRALGGLVTGALGLGLPLDETTVLAKKKKKCPKLRPNRCGKKCCKAFETCKKGKCVDHCEDGKPNFGETDVDCGGGDCNPCRAGLKCKEAGDCLSGICRATSISGTLRCHECTRDADCTTDFTKPFCVNTRCVACRSNTDCQNTGRPHCLAGASPERDGTCVECLNDSNCPNGQLCDPLINRCFPCASAQAQGEQVHAASCQDTCANGVQDGDETDIDCGGSCSAMCADGQHCLVNSDCQSGLCDETGTCTSACLPPGAECGTVPDLSACASCCSRGACCPGVEGSDCSAPDAVAFCCDVGQGCRGPNGTCG